MAHDPWVCKCGHEYEFTGIGTSNVQQVPHACPFECGDVDELTKDWLDVFERGKRDGELATSPFFRLVPLIGLPNGVDDTHPRVIAAIGDIQRAVTEADHD